ncbi:MAG TPA: YkgJ family cysteine cluster protein, partial [Polyangiales bacterium]
TDHRSYWDALPVDPLAPGEDPAIWLARDAFQQALHGPWAKALARALDATALIAEVARSSTADASSLWHRTQALHASGFPVDAGSSQTCGDCGFGFRDGSGMRCRKTRALPSQRGKRVDESARACVRFEPVLTEAECRRCGACCREGFDRVEVRAREPVTKRHPQLVVVDAYGAHLPRPHGQCVALTATSEGHTCRIYADRPRSCAEFELAGDACLTARRRVGLSA